MTDEQMIALLENSYGLLVSDLKYGQVQAIVKAMRCAYAMGQNSERAIGELSNQERDLGLFMTAKEALEAACEKVGGQKRLAEILNISEQAVSQWKRIRGAVPRERLGEVSAATGISPDVLRPDLYLELPAGEIDIRMGRKLRRLRNDMGWSRREMAEKLNTQESQIQKMENGERKFTAEWIVRLAGVFEVEPGSFFQLPAEGWDLDKWCFS